MIGNNRVDEALGQLLEITDKLKLIPEAVVTSIRNPEHFQITEDVDNFDYVYSLDDLTNLRGQSYRGQRKKIHRFRDQFADIYEVRDIDFSDPKTQERILETFAWWASDRGRTHEDVSNEHQAIRRLLSNSSKLHLTGSEIFINNKAAGFSIHEILNGEYTVCHFHKTILKFVGIDVFLTIYAAKELSQRGYKLENWEQDLGIAGLRELKLSYKPTKMLKKYQIQRM